MNIKSFLSPKHNRQRSGLQDHFEQILLLIESARSLFTQSELLKKVVASEKAAVEKSSSASHEISSMVSTTATAASELSNVAKASNEAVESSVNSLTSLTALIQVVDQSSKTLQSSVGTGLREIASVTDTLAEIRDKAKIINEIVFQTKLLSFNASVEAARAGEHGKGFAVVAEEMGNLARASGEAAKEIETILNSGVERTKTQISRVSGDLEKVASETIHAIADVSAKSSEISSSISQLLSYSKNTEEKSREISSATREQNIGVQEITQSLQSLEKSSVALDQMATNGHTNSAELASKIEAISLKFEELAKSLGYGLIKPEKPFDFQAAISAHVDWKMKLSKYLANPDGSLDHQKVCMDNTCMLGKWIYGDGTKYRAMDDHLFRSLQDSHKTFHKTAGSIIELINAGRHAEAAKVLGPSGPYLTISEKTVELIQEIQTLADNRHKSTIKVA